MMRTAVRNLLRVILGRPSVDALHTAVLPHSALVEFLSQRADRMARRAAREEVARLVLRDRILCMQRSPEGVQRAPSWDPRLRIFRCGLCGWADPATPAEGPEVPSGVNAHYPEPWGTAIRALQDEGRLDGGGSGVTDAGGGWEWT